MNSIITEHRTKDGRSPTHVDLLRDPLIYIAEDHLRLRVKCVDMDKLAMVKEPEQDALCDLLSYLRDDLPMLLTDEDEILMPLVLKRADPEDDMPSLVARLQREHQEIEAALATTIEGLTEACLTQIMSWELRDNLQKLANATRRHLILENAVLLPLARTRLTEEDLDILQFAMLKRRGLDAMIRR